jgi:hypothetical protein
VNHREETGLPLDGNAAAGLLGELVALDVTFAEITRGSCGVVAREFTAGSWEQYFAAPDAIAFVMRLVHRPVGIWLDMRGSRCLFTPSVER